VFVFSVHKTTELQINTNLQKTTEMNPGTVLEGGKVVCGQSTLLQIKTLKPEGKSEMAIGDFLNGYRDFVGSRFD